MNIYSIKNKIREITFSEKQPVSIKLENDCLNVIFHSSLSIYQKANYALKIREIEQIAGYCIIEGVYVFKLKQKGPITGNSLMIL